MAGRTAMTAIMWRMHRLLAITSMRRNHSRQGRQGQGHSMTKQGPSSTAGRGRAASILCTTP